VSTQYSPTVVQASEETHTFAPGRVLTRHDTSQLPTLLKTKTNGDLGLIFILTTISSYNRRKLQTVLATNI
jgi:hypothetical protein